MGDLLREWNDLDAAERHLAQAMELLRDTLTVDAEDVALGYLTLARLQHARGEHDHRRSDAADLHGPGPPARLCRPPGRAGGGGAGAARAGRRATSRPPSPGRRRAVCTPPMIFSFPREAEYLILARVWIAQAEQRVDPLCSQQALHLLARLLEDATAKGRMGSVLEILIVRALANGRRRARDDALATIERALVLAAPEGYIRRFVDEGPPMLTLLHAAAAHGIAPDYITRLLAAFPATLKAEGGTRNIASANLPSASHVLPLVEPLSQRELEVLRLIAVGKSNAEIAQTLVIALSTVKTHTNSIFGKLQVTSRTQALARAHDLQLI